MDLGYAPKTKDFCERLQAFMDDHVAPRDAEWRNIARAGAFLWAWGGALRFIDGPEVHLRTVAKAEMQKTGHLAARALIAPPT